MKRRVFVAVTFPELLREQVSDLIKQWRWLPARWLKPENWHITLVPPVYFEGGEIDLLKDVLSKGWLGKPFAVKLSRVVLAPPGGKARMIWLEGETPPELAKLKKKIETLWLAEARLPRFEEESRSLKLHVTLARFEPGDLREIEEKTRVLGETKFNFKVKEVSIMESHLRPEGAEYETVAGFELS